ncbi:amidase signature domain-containing protein [Pyronema omphalodes]|nr:amidase signature domain-containing protein [Pyronema omphalodes]
MSLSQVSEAINTSNQTSQPKPWDIQDKESLDIPVLSSAYASSSLTPTQLIEALHSRLSSTPGIEKIFLHLEPLSSLQSRALSLEAKYPQPDQRPPLYGIPFSIKDSIDVVSIPTSAACAALRYTPIISSPIVEKLLSLGCILIGKTNMDQLATGLTGCRSPFGIPPNARSPEHIPGGSSSGACVSVAAGLVSFALGSDTAGSGRVPAGFNGIVGFKPTKGTVSLKGVVKACEGFDCIAYECLSVGSARILWRLTRGFDMEDRMAKQRIATEIQVCCVKEDVARKFSVAVPPGENLDVCSEHYRRGFKVAVERLQALGITVTELSDKNWEVFEAAGKLLYEGSFIMERLAGLPKGWLDENIQSLHPVTQQVFQSARSRSCSAEDLFRDLHSMMSLRRQVQNLFKGKEGFDLVMVPTTPMIPTIKEVEESPLKINTLLGTFSHAANVLDLCAITLPVGSGDGPPFSVTLMGAEREDAELLMRAAVVEDVLKGV